MPVVNNGFIPDTWEAIAHPQNTPKTKKELWSESGLSNPESGVPHPYSYLQWWNACSVHLGVISEETLRRWLASAPPHSMENESDDEAESLASLLSACQKSQVNGLAWKADPQAPGFLPPILLAAWKETATWSKERWQRAQEENVQDVAPSTAIGRNAGLANHASTPTHPTTTSSTSNKASKEDLSVVFLLKTVAEHIMRTWPASVLDSLPHPHAWESASMGPERKFTDADSVISTMASRSLLRADSSWCIEMAKRLSPEALQSVFGMRRWFRPIPEHADGGYDEFAILWPDTWGSFMARRPKIDDLLDKWLVLPGMTDELQDDMRCNCILSQCHRDHEKKAYRASSPQLMTPPLSVCAWFLLNEAKGDGHDSDPGRTRKWDMLMDWFHAKPPHVTRRLHAGAPRTTIDQDMQWMCGLLEGMLNEYRTSGLPHEAAYNKCLHSFQWLSVWQESQPSPDEVSGKQAEPGAPSGENLFQDPKDRAYGAFLDMLWKNRPDVKEGSCVTRTDVESLWLQLAAANQNLSACLQEIGENAPRVFLADSSWSAQQRACFGAEKRKAHGPIMKWVLDKVSKGDWRPTEEAWSSAMHAFDSGSAVSGVGNDASLRFLRANVDKILLEHAREHEAQPDKKDPHPPGPSAEKSARPVSKNHRRTF